MLYKKCGNQKYCKDNDPQSCPMFKLNKTEINRIEKDAKDIFETHCFADIWEKPL